MSDFDPDAYIQANSAPKGDFDPDAYLAAQSSHGMDVLDSGGIGQAALEHYGNAATLGYLPQLQALASKFVPNPNAGIDAKLAAQGINVQNAPDSYVTNRDANIARLNQESQVHPVASGAGTLAGILASGAGLGGLAGGARAANIAGRILQGAKTGAAMGALANPGDTQGEIDPFQVDQRLKNAKTGALVGGAVSGAVEAAPYLKQGLGYAARKLGSTISGVPQAEIDNYAARTDQINQMIDQSGGELPAAADKLRQNTQDAIRATRAKLSGQISASLQNAPSDATIDIQPVKDQLNKILNRLNPNLQADAVDQINDTLGKLETEAAKNGGKVSVQQLNQITDFLQDRARGAYMKGGQIFQSSSQAAQAAKGAAAVARKLLNEAVPEVAQANNQLSMLHSLEDSLNKNLIAPGKSDSALFAAGAGTNPRNAKMLGRLGTITGTNPLQDAQDLATMRTFANPALLPTDATGKSATRMMLAAGAGHLLAGPAGLAAGALASPAAVKLGINAANAVAPAVNAVGRVVQNNPVLLQRIAQSVTTPAQNQNAPEPQIDDQTLGVFKANPGLLDSVADPAVKNAIAKRLGRSPAQGQPQPTSGYGLFFQDGAQKLGLDNDTLQRAMGSRQGQGLLIQAHSLSAGSPSLKKIKAQLQKGFGTP